MKALQLGINYGMGVRSLSRGLNRHPLIGSEVIIRHQRKYPRFWEWRAGMVERAMLERVIVSEFDGWPLHISTSPNKRTLYNFPMQSGGAEMLRLAANRLCDAGLVPSMLVHDGILLELDNEEQVQHAIEIMRIAGTEVCGGLEIGVDIDQKLDGRRALSGQAASGTKDVGDRDGRAARAWCNTGSGGGVNVLDKTKSYKIRGGKLVERTAEEQAELRAAKSRILRQRRGKSRRTRSKEPFVMLTMPQLEKLFGLRSHSVRAPLHGHVAREFPAPG